MSNERTRELEKTKKNLNKITKKHEKLHKLELRPNKGAEDKLATGNNSSLYMDGKPMRGVHRFALEAQARGLVKATIEMYVKL